jgi:hypothetical protein
MELSRCKRVHTPYWALDDCFTLERRAMHEAQVRTGQQRDPTNLTSQPHIVGDKISLQSRTHRKRRMPQLLKVDERRVSLHEFRPAGGLTHRRRALREAEEAVELGQDADGAQPDASVRVELGEKPVFELLDRRTAILARFFETANRAC